MSSWTPEEVADLIERFIGDGPICGYEWDDFISCPDEDPRMRAIQEECNALSARFPTAVGYCGPEGFERLREIARVLREWGCEIPGE